MKRRKQVLVRVTTLLGPFFHYIVAVNSFSSSRSSEEGPIRSRSRLRLGDDETVGARLGLWCRLNDNLWAGLVLRCSDGVLRGPLESTFSVRDEQRAGHLAACVQHRYGCLDCNWAPVYQIWLISPFLYGGRGGISEVLESADDPDFLDFPVSADDGVHNNHCLGSFGHWLRRR